MVVDFHHQSVSKETFVMIVVMIGQVSAILIEILIEIAVHILVEVLHSETVVDHEVVKDWNV